MRMAPTQRGHGSVVV